MSERKKAHIFAHNHRPVEDPMGELILVMEKDGKLEFTVRSKAFEQKITRGSKVVDGKYEAGRVETVMSPGGTGHVALDRGQALDLSNQLREWAERK